MATRVVSTNGQRQEDEQPEATELGFRDLLGYLKTAEGHQIFSRVLDLVDGLKKATLDERVKSNALQADIAKLTISRKWWLQTIGLLAVTSAIVGLSVADKLTPAAATILGAIVGYLLADGRRKES